ncbi:MAG: MATE family efflux transporter [Sterolibacteriaceae bacterium MAG5]|nr:MATE family efflux transporter [Candidatus Nitricoxidireducens bremensis]
MQPTPAAESPSPAMEKPASLARELARLAWPVLIAQLAVMASGVADTVMAGRLSALDLAAVGIGASIYVTVFVSIMGVLLALTPTVAHHYGAGRYTAIGADVTQSAWMALALATIAVLLLRNPEPFLALTQLQPAVEAKVRAYLDAVSWSVPAALAFRLFYGFSSGIGRTRPIMIFNLAGLALKVPLNAVLMYGLFGLPALGSTGCGVATAIVAWITALAAWGWSARHPAYREFALFARFEPPRPAAIAALLKLGLPIGATFLVDVTAFTFMALFIARLGPTASGAHQIAANLAALTFMLPLSLGNATAVLAGQALGAGDRRRARRAGWYGIALGMGLALAVSLLLWFGAAPIAALYTPDPAVRAAAATLIVLVAVYHLADALQAVAVNALRGYRKSTVPMVIYAVALWGLGLGGGVAIGLGDGLGAPLGAAGFWIAAIASLALAGGLVTFYFERVSRSA